MDKFRIRIARTLGDFRMIAEAEGIPGQTPGLYREISEDEFDAYIEELVSRPDKIDGMFGERPAVDEAMLALGLHVIAASGIAAKYTNIKNQDGSPLKPSNGFPVADMPSMVVTLIKDIDDWFWIYFQFKARSRSRMLPYFGSDSSNATIEDNRQSRILFYRCDQLRGLIELLRSQETREMAALYPGGTHVKDDL